MAHLGDALACVARVGYFRNVTGANEGLSPPPHYDRKRRDVENHFAGVVSMARENRTLALCLLAMSAAVLIGLLVAGPALAVSTTFTVNRTTNEADASAAYGVCDFDAATTGNQCTLRAAI